MSEHYESPYRNPTRYVPSTLSELQETIMAVIGGAPTFIDPLEHFPDDNIDAIFAELTGGLAKVRELVGQNNYARLLGLSMQAKELFAADQDNTNGKSVQGIKLMLEIEEIIQSVRRTRVETQEKDEDGKVSGD